MNNTLSTQSTYNFSNTKPFAPFSGSDDSIAFEPERDRGYRRTPQPEPACTTNREPQAASETVRLDESCIAAMLSRWASGLAPGAAPSPVAAQPTSAPLTAALEYAARGWRV